MIENILNQIKLLLDGNHDMDSLEFSYCLEEYLIDNYDVMYKENAEITELLNNELPEVCAMMEPGIDDKEFKELLKKEYEIIEKELK